MHYESLVRTPQGHHQLIGTPSKITLHEPNDIKPMFQTKNVEPSDNSVDSPVMLKMSSLGKTDAEPIASGTIEPSYDFLKQY